MPPSLMWPVTTIDGPVPKRSWTRACHLGLHRKRRLCPPSHLTCRSACTPVPPNSPPPLPSTPGALSRYTSRQHSACSLITDKRHSQSTRHHDGARCWLLVTRSWLRTCSISAPSKPLVARQ